MSDSMPISSKPSTNVDSAAAAEAFTPMTHMSKGEADALIRKLIHPPTAQEICGLPSGGARSQVILELKQLKSMNPPIIFGPTVATSIYNDTLERRFAPSLLVLNGARVAAVQFGYDTSLDGAYAGFNYQDRANVYYNDSIDFTTWATNANLFRLIYKSTTVSLNATMFNDIGIVGAFQFTPSLLFSGTLAKFLDTSRVEALGFLSDCFKTCGSVLNPEKGFIGLHVGKEDLDHKFHAIHADHHFYDQAKANWLRFPRSVRHDIIDHLNNCHFATSNKLVFDADGTKYVLSLNPDSNIQILNLNNCGLDANNQAPTMNQVVSTGRDYSTDAKEGCFMVQRLTQPNVQWLNATRTSGRGDAPVPYLYGCYVFTNPGATYVPLYERQVIPGATNTNVLRDTAWTDQMTMGWIVFDGLFPNIATLGSAAYTQLLNIKCITGIEVQNAVGGAYSPLAKPGPIQDEALMEKVLFTLNEFKDGMPASFNSWGMLAALAGNVISNVAPKLINRFLTPKAAKFIHGFLKPNTLKADVKKVEKKIIAKAEKKAIKDVAAPTTPRRRKARVIVAPHKSSHAPMEMSELRKIIREVTAGKPKPQRQKARKT